MSVRIAGFCPMGCGESLFVGAEGHVTCGHLSCPNPTAVDDILNDSEIHHIIELLPKTFNVRHPLRERLNNELLECNIGDWLVEEGGPPYAVGRYQVIWDGTGYGHWIRISHQ